MSIVFVRFFQILEGVHSMLLKDRIKSLCKFNKIPVSKLENDLDFAGGYIAKLDKSSPNIEKINAIANYFNVSIDFLMGKTDMVTCSICGFGDDPLSEYSRKEHEEFHERFLSIKEKYPFFTKYSDSDKKRNESIAVLRNNDILLDEKIKAFEKYLEASFSLEVFRRNYDINWLDYEDFCRTEVAIMKPDHVISEALIEILCEKYGVNNDFVTFDAGILARTSNRKQLMRILGYAEKLSPKTLDSIEIQLKALAENEQQG